jgi:hypothetical protein
MLLLHSFLGLFRPIIAHGVSVFVLASSNSQASTTSIMTVETGVKYPFNEKTIVRVKERSELNEF